MSAALLKLETRLPRRDLNVFKTVAEHFQTTPQSIMQCNAIGELGCIRDSPFRVLAMHDEFLRAAVDMVPLELWFIPSAHCLLETAAANLRRPLSEFVTAMLISSADTLSSELAEDGTHGGIGRNPELVEWRGEWLKFEFAARRGCLPVDSSGLTPWFALEMELAMPAVLAAAEPAPPSAISGLSAAVKINVPLPRQFFWNYPVDTLKRAMFDALQQETAAGWERRWTTAPSLQKHLRRVRSFKVLREREFVFAEADFERVMIAAEAISETPETLLAAIAGETEGSLSVWKKVEQHRNPPDVPPSKILQFAR